MGWMFGGRSVAWRRLFLPWIGLACVASAAVFGHGSAAATDAPITAAELEHFERRIRPLLAESCYECHSGKSGKTHGGLELDTVRGLREGGDSGPLWVGGQPAESLLYQVLEHEHDIAMPPDGKLSDASIEAVAVWITAGAPLPAETSSEERVGMAGDPDAGRDFWSFQPLRSQVAPNSTWARNRVDAFLHDAMKERGIAPSPRAERWRLVRRLSFDLRGLPPATEEVSAYVEAGDPLAWSRLVDRWLASPEYGQKWARMWLDRARYTDKTASWLDQTGQAYLYRDWVVGAFNEDMPYDQFVVRQLATDYLDETGPEDLPALGFLSLSPTYWKELKLPSEIIKVIVADEWEERVDAVSRTFLGLTVACARCHDHKFDPITSADYYAMAGVFASCRREDRSLLGEEAYAPVRAAKAQVAEWEAKLVELKKRDPVPVEEVQSIEQQMARLRAETPHYHDPLANALIDESLYVVRAGATAQEGTKLEYREGPRDLPVFIRGNPNRPGEPVRRRFLEVLSQERPPRLFERGSGRLDLARAIVEDARGLAARVIVNRVWLEHFGRGIVETPSNFGQQGDRPSHPRLLDDLAHRFVQHEWSIKRLHREILLSAAWQQTSLVSAEHEEADPENEWLARMRLRRLGFEAWRDAMLVASGQLDRRFGGPAVDLHHASNVRRTLYTTVHRRDMETTLQIHDFPDPTQHNPQRSVTVTPLQGLYALNGPLLMEQADRLAERLQRECGRDIDAGVQRLHQLLFSRGATPAEMELARRFLSGASAGRDGGGLGESVELLRWRQYIHMQLASNELMFVD